MLKPIVLMLTLIFSLGATAEVSVRGTELAMHYGSTRTTAGGVWITVDGDDLAGASIEEPIYLRLGLSRRVELADTLVKPNNTMGALSPINLPAGVNGPVEMNMRPDAVRIVRWVAHEHAIWVAVTQPTGTWLRVEGEPAAPTSMRSVSFAVGHSAEEIASRMGSGPLSYEHANLPYVQRADGKMADTTLWVDIAYTDLRITAEKPQQTLQFTHRFQRAELVEQTEDPILIRHRGVLDVAMAEVLPIIGRVSWDEQDHFLPWIPKQADYSAELQLANSGLDPMALVLSTVDSNGAAFTSTLTLGSLQKQFISPYDLFPDAVAPFALRVKGSSAPIHMILTNVGTGEKRHVASQSGFHSSLTFHITRSEKRESHVVLLNTAGDDREVLITAYDAAGEQVNRAVIVVLPPQVPRAFSAGEFTRAAGDLSLNVRGGFLTGLAFVFDESGTPTIHNPLLSDTH